MSMSIIARELSPGDKICLGADVWMVKEPPKFLGDTDIIRLILITADRTIKVFDVYWAVEMLLAEDEPA